MFISVQTRNVVNMTSTEIINILKDTYPKINKSTVCMANHTSEYGVVFCDDALKKLNKTGNANKKIKIRKPKGKKLQVNLKEEEIGIVELRIKTLGISKQEYLKSLIEKDVLKEFENA